MRILSFDTSADAICVSLLDTSLPADALMTEQPGSEQVVQEAIVSERDGQTRQEAVAALMPTIASLIEQAGWKKSEIDLLVVGEGPGSFTGIRTGVVTARTLAQAMQLPLVGVSLLECYAVSCELPALIVIAAGRGRYFIAGYSSFANGKCEVALASQSIEGDALEQACASFERIYADRKGFEELRDMPAFAGTSKLYELPNLENIATKQAKIAKDRVSLTISQAQTAESSSQSGDTRQFLTEIFPYSSIQPLYLRSPSVTLKKPVS